MRSVFGAYFRPTESEFKELWDSAAIVLDANFLLDLYRVSEQTREVFKKILEAFKSRVHVPHQFALEFARNRPTAIVEHIGAYDGAAKKLAELIALLENKARHPFVSDSTLQQLREAAEELRNRSKEQQKLLSEDDELTKWLAAFISTEVIGAACDSARLKQIFELGQQRYRDKIPPGYMDADKPEPRRYGDLVGWLQIIQHAQAAGCNVLLVTSEQKEDWWLKEDRRWTIGPRPELVEEFASATTKRFYAYNTQTFLRYAARFASVDVPDDALREVQEVEQANRDREAFEKPKARSLDVKSGVAATIEVEKSPEALLKAVLPEGTT